jgi:hypothetical protein
MSIRITAQQYIEAGWNAYLRSTNGRLLGRPVEGKRLLTGFLVCECGSRFEAVKNWGWRGSHAYVCSARRRKGPDVCPSTVAFDVDEIENVFLNVVEGSVLHRDFIDRVVDAVCSPITPTQSAKRFWMNARSWRVKSRT